MAKFLPQRASGSRASGKAFTSTASAARSSPGGAGTRTGGKDGSWLGAQSPLHALRRRCGNAHRNLRRRTNGLQPDPRPCLPFKANLLRFRAFSSDVGGSAARPFRRRRNGRRTAGRATSTPCVAQARLSRTRSFKLRAIINRYAPITMRSPYLPIPTKPPVCNGMIAPRDSWMMPPPLTR